ncbi:transcriptional regulator [Rhizobium sp. FKY42]|uniref:transcriptional regulator n=1 Tax=Rhizobium sp. FKY42 TaxID=2562310 RepID=UPI0010C14809|nr:transcriptional regulator [Rhizobium sp. FKY42]
MNRGPLSARSTVDPVEKANAAWGNSLPDWVVVLAETCRHNSQSAVAKRIDYSPAVVSSVLSNSYKGDISRVEQMVRGALMSETVICPALGDIARNVCLDWQSKPYAATSSHRAAMFHACRANCPNSRLSPKGDDDAL